jgi:phosphonoacetate hydrolase
MGQTTVVICIDGLDPQYLEACETPNLRALGDRGFLNSGECMMPSVTNVNNVSLVTASYPEDHGVCSNYWWDRDRNSGAYVESPDHILRETFFQRAQRLGKRSVLVTSKDKLRTLLGKGATLAVSSEQPPGWVVAGAGPTPHIYSLEVNGWAIRAASYMLTQQDADLVYITTTDYAMHTFGPEHPRSQEHMSILDGAIGELMEAHPGVTLLLTADHGMSPKSRMVDLRRTLEKYGIAAVPVPIIKDRYVAHHSNLGGCMYVYLDAPRLQEALNVLRETPGVEEALPREEAAARFRLPADRIGDVVVVGERDVVFGDPSEVELPPGLRSHGSTHETRIPILGYNGDFATFSFETNRDVGRYVFERVLA